jgi:hypothetical protein
MVREKMSQFAQTDKPIDPYSIEGTLTRCVGITESINKAIANIREGVRPYSFNSDMAPSQKLESVSDEPNGRSDLALRLEGLYKELELIEDRLNVISSNISS